MKKQSRGWWSVALGAALLAPTAAPQPAAAGPFDYVKAADSQKNQQQEQERRQADERDRQQREQQQREQQQRQAEQRSRQEQEQRARQEQERQRQAEQQRQAERQRQVEQQREVERQRQAERQQQVERQRQAEQQERARAVQQERERERQQAEQAHARQEQQAREEQLREQQRAREEQIRRAREERAAREQTRRVQEQQPGSVRRVSTGPFDYIRRTDQVRNQPQPSQPQQPVRQEPQRSQPIRQETQRPVREEHQPVPRSAPFGYIPGQSGSPTRGTPPQGSSVPGTNSGYRPSPFGSVRPGSPSAYQPPSPHTEIIRPPRSFPPVHDGRGGNYPTGSVRPRPSSGGGSHTEVATPVTPVPRGGRGTLDGYFGRPPRRHREGNPRYYPGPYYGGYPGYGYGYGGYYPYPAGGYYDNPYDCYPPPVYYPPSSPSVVVVPAPEVVVVPEQEPVPEVVEPEPAPEVVETATLDEVIADIEDAWERGKLDLLMRHVRPNGEIQIYRDGEWVDSLSRAQFEQKTDQAFRDYDTVSMRFERPELLSDDESGNPRARARATHLYRTRTGQQRRVRVTYAFRRYGRVWRIVGLDYEPVARQRAALPSSSHSAPIPLKGAAASLAGEAPPAAVHSAAAPTLHLVSAPPFRVRDLLNAHRPRQIAALKWIKGAQKTQYTVQAMRGVAPGTLAWALYRQANKRPVETGVTDVSALSNGGWLALRVQGPQLVTLAASAATRPRLARLATRTFAGVSLALAPTQPPAKMPRRVRHRPLRSR